MLHLTSAQQQAIFDHAEQTYDEECCGLLLGKQHQAVGEMHRYVHQVLPLVNHWQATIAAEIRELATTDPACLTKSQRYWIDPRDLLMAQRRARDLGLALIGVYHSHPDRPAIPSVYDRACAWSGYAYVIVSVQQGIAQQLCSWHLDEHHQFQPETVIQVVSPPVMLTP